MRPIPRPALLATIFVFNLIEFLQSGMIVFASAPTMGRIGASPEQYSLVTALYAAVAVLSISQMTVLVQRLGWRDFLLGAVLLFLGGSWLCAGATSLGAVVTGRRFLAAGGGVFMTAARMMVNLIPPSPQRIQGIAAFGGALASGMAVAPVAAAFLVDAGAWSGIFLLLALLGAIAGAATLLWMPADAVTLDGTRSGFDPGDGMLLGGGAFLLLFALQRLSYDWHGERVLVAGLLAAGAGLLAWFVLSHRRHGQPFVRLEMLRSRRYLTGLAIFSVCYGLLGTFNGFMPHLVQRVLGVAYRQAGELQSAGLSAAVPTFVVMLLLVKRRPHPTKFYVTAFVLLAAFGWHFAHLDPAAPAWRGVAPWIGLFGAFVVPGMAITALHSFKDLQHDNVLFSNAQQLKNMLGQFGLALGSGCAAILLQQRGALHGARLAENAAAAPAVLAQQGALLAGIDAFWALVWIGVAGAAVLAFQRRFD
jgi:predicted MFS family arabinose efflux permease